MRRSIIPTVHKKMEALLQWEQPWIKGSTRLWLLELIETFSVKFILSKYAISSKSKCLTELYLFQLSFHLEGFSGSRAAWTLLKTHTHKLKMIFLSWNWMFQQNSISQMGLKVLFLFQCRTKCWNLRSCHKMEQSSSGQLYRLH